MKTLNNRLSRDSIDDAIFSVKKKMWRKCTVNESKKYISPLVYYIETGRAPTEFLKIIVNLSERQKSTIANRLIKNHGNDEAAINSICKYMGFKRNCI